MIQKFNSVTSKTINYPLVVVPRSDEQIYTSHGGKGKMLGFLSQNGFNIVRGVILSDTVHKEFLDCLPLKEAQRTSTHKILTSCIRKELITGLNSLGIKNRRLIVRSSASVEDGTAHSFAGMFKSISNVGIDKLDLAVGRVYSSISNPILVRYAKFNRIDINRIKMAVLIQEFIQTEVFGVLFTSDPVFRDQSKIIIEYNLGDPEALVSGSKTPTTISINIRPHIDFNLKMLDASLGNLHGLNESQIQSLMTIVNQSLKAESLLGVPVDIEWGIVGKKDYIFQIRPITTR